MENVSLIDVSFEDDLLIPSSSQELLGSHATHEVEKIEKASKELEHIPKLSDSPEQNHKRSDRYNLRKSLAWDSAFFTNEGILNSEELAVMNSTYIKPGITLPGIQEEFRKSSESTTTLESDTRALEQLEVNLFENVRLSIQKSLSNSNHSRKKVHSEKIKEQKKHDARSSRSQEKIDVSSQTKLKLRTASRRNDLTRPQQEHISKDRLICPSHSNLELKPLIKSTKVSRKDILLPASLPGKKASTEMMEIKRNTGKALPGVTAKKQSVVAFNKSNESAGIIRSAAQSTKSKTFMNAKDEYSGRIPHPNLVKSSLSFSKVSPSSSIDTAASESSSSAASVSTKLLRPLEWSDDGTFTSALAFSSSLGISKNSGSLSQSCIYDRARSNVNNDSGARLAKPSGLRMPRPTVGFFDKEKSLLHSSNKVPKPNLQHNLSKNTGLNVIVGASKMRPINLPSVKDRGVSSAQSKQALKFSVQEVPTRIENRKIPSPKVKRTSSETDTSNHKNDSEDGVHISEVSRGHVLTAEQRTQYQSYITHCKEESVKSNMNSADRETGKDNMFQLKIEGQSNVHQIKDQCAAIEKLAETISSLSLSNAIDVHHT